MGIRKIIREELEGFKNSTEEDWAWAENSEDGYIIDTENSELSVYKILSDLHDDGYTWSKSTPIMDSYDNLNITPFRYILVGPLTIKINDNPFFTKNKEIMHDQDISYYSEDMSDFVITL